MLSGEGGFTRNNSIAYVYLLLRVPHFHGFFSLIAVCEHVRMGQLAHNNAFADSKLRMFSSLQVLQATKESF